MTEITPGRWRPERGGGPRIVALLGAFAVALGGLAVGSSPAAASTVTLGPQLPTDTGGSEGCAFEHPDCSWFNTALPSGVFAQAPADGTLTRWRVEAFEGTAQLLVLQGNSNGTYTIVAKSAAETKPCVESSSGCFPAFDTVYTFSTDMSVAKGEYLGIELESPSNCASSPDDDTCASVGEYNGTGTTTYTATSQYFDPTPAVGAATKPENLGGQPQNGAMTVNADETTIAEPTTAETIGGGSPSELYRCPVCGDPVNAATGELSQSYTDFAIPGRGVGLAFTRTYSSAQASVEGPLGFGWTDSYAMSLSVASSTGNVTVHEETGSAVTFAKSGSSYAAPSRVLATLVKNSNGTFTFTRDQSGLKYVFNQSGELTSETDRNGYVTSLQYSSGKLSTVTDQAGRTLTFAYASNGRIGSVTDPIGEKVSFAYDSTGDLTTVTDAGGGVWGFEYNASHQLVKLTDPRGNATSDAYDSSGRLITQTDPLGRVTRYAYSAGVTIVTLPSGNELEDRFAGPLLTSETLGYGSSHPATTNYAYDPATLGASAIVDGDGKQWQRTYDSAGDLLSSTDPLGRATQFTYNALHEMLTRRDPTGETLTDTYDAEGNLLSSSTKLGSSTLETTYAYNAGQPGELVTRTDPNGHAWHYTYDKYGNRITATDPDGGTTTMTYNAIGRLLSSTDPRGYATTDSYDPFGDIVKQVDPRGGTTTYRYDADRDLVGVTDALGHTISTTYNADDEPTSKSWSNSSATVLETQASTYDADGNLATQTDGAADETKYAYDPLDRLASVTDPLGHLTSYGYDRNGNLISKTDASGRVTSYTYDAAGERTKVAYSDGTTHAVTFSYNANGNPATMSDGTGATTYTYDQLHRLTKVTNGAGQSIGYAYDAAGNITSITYPSGQQVSRTFDAANRLTTVTDWLGHKFTFSYDKDGNLTGEAYPNGVTTAIAYDAGDQPTSIVDDKGSTTLLSRSYTRDVLGQVTAVGGGTVSYDPLQRVTASHLGASQSFGYDAANRLTRAATGTSAETFAYNSGGELTSATVGSATSSFSYDAEGERTASTPSTGNGDSYTYDQAGRLTGFKQGSTAAAYLYNGDGLRIKKTIGSTSEQYVWDVAQGAPRLIESGTTMYVDGPGMLPLEQIGAANAPMYYHQDQLGSTVMLTNSAGAIAGSYSYTAYGAVSSHTGTASTPLQYGGGLTDSESGLIYLQNRYYDPATAQFLTVDPLGAQTEEPYAYAGDNPTNAIDPAGAAPGFTGEYGGWTVLSGHGVASGDSFVVPPGASITFFGPPGFAMQDSLGGAVETGTVGTNNSGIPGPAVVYTQTYTEGMVVPNYQLLPPVNPALNIQGGENDVTVTSPTPLSDLVQAGGGSYAWAACRVGQPYDPSLTGGNMRNSALIANNGWGVTGGSIGGGIVSLHAPSPPAVELNDVGTLAKFGVSATQDSDSGVIQINQAPLPQPSSFEDQIIGGTSAS